VTIVHGLKTKALNEDGTENRLSVFSDITGLFIRKPIIATIVISMNTAILI
jgi:hypothetical protein